MSCNLRAFSSLTAKRRYTLKSPALAFLKLNMYDLFVFQMSNLSSNMYNVQVLFYIYFTL